jgi:hypothetical protein
MNVKKEAKRILRKKNTKSKRIPAKEKCKRAMRITDGVF